MEDQPDSSVQILNNTSKEPLHVFFQVLDLSEKWSKLDSFLASVIFQSFRLENGTPVNTTFGKKGVSQNRD